MNPEMKDTCEYNDGEWVSIGVSNYECRNYIVHNMDDIAPTIKDVFFTSYNAEVGQTDSTPCIAGGTVKNICQASKEGIRTIALSQEFLSWSRYSGKGGVATFKPGDKVMLVSKDFPDDWRCNGEFEVWDALNARFVGGDKKKDMKRRGDIFMLNRKDNISCHADVYRI